jgi:large subunit ribosomal protein L6
MSRIGKQPITIPNGVTVRQTGGTVTVKSDKAELKQVIPAGIKLEIDSQRILVKPQKTSHKTKALHGLVRSLIANMIIGVTDGFEKVLELHGTGYRVKAQGEAIELSLGYSHPIIYTPPQGVTLTVEGNKTIKVKGFDKQLVGQAAADIRHFRPPDAYKGKGVRYQNETVRLKPGKSAKAAEA